MNQPAQPSRPSLPRQVLLLVGKDLLLEWRSRARILSVLLFGVTTLLLFSFAVGPDSGALAAAAGGFLVLSLLLASTLALGESFRLETEQQALEGLLLLPVDPLALYYSKTIANTAFLALLGPVLVPLAIVLYGVSPGPRGVFLLLGLWLLAAAGLSAPGVLYAAMTSTLESQDVLLPLLLFPLVIPVLLASVKATSLVLLGDPMRQLGSWLVILVAFAAIYWSIGGVLFPRLVEET